MPSPRPTPTALKLVRGNPGKRALNKREPKAGRGVAGCPEHLTEVGRSAWVRLQEMLTRVGVLTELDAAALERLCDCYADIMESRELIQKHGRVYETTSAEGNYLIKANPAVNQLRAADMLFKSYLIEFGLTPAARSKVTTQDGEEKADPLAQYFA